MTRSHGTGAAKRHALEDGTETRRLLLGRSLLLLFGLGRCCWLGFCLCLGRLRDACLGLWCSRCRLRCFRCCRLGCLCLLFGSRNRCRLSLRRGCGNLCCLPGLRSLRCLGSRSRLSLRGERHDLGRLCALCRLRPCVVTIEVDGTLCCREDACKPKRSLGKRSGLGDCDMAVRELLLRCCKLL